MLSMLLAAGLLDLQLYVVKPAGHSLGLKVLTYTYLDPVAFDEAQQAYIDSWKDDHNPLIQVIVGDQFWSDGTDLSELTQSRIADFWAVDSKREFPNH